MTNNDHQRPDVYVAAARERPKPQDLADPRHFLRNKRQEWEEYRSQVTAFELRKSLPVL